MHHRLGDLIYNPSQTIARFFSHTFLFTFLLLPSFFLVLTNTKRFQVPPGEHRKVPPGVAMEKLYIPMPQQVRWWQSGGWPVTSTASIDHISHCFSPLYGIQHDSLVLICTKKFTKPMTTIGVSPSNHIHKDRPQNLKMQHVYHPNIMETSLRCINITSSVESLLRRLQKVVRGIETHHAGMANRYSLMDRSSTKSLWL